MPRANFHPPEKPKTGNWPYSDNGQPVHRRRGSEDHSTTKGKCKIGLTLTGLLMEGPILSEFGDNFRVARDTGVGILVRNNLADQY
jgi:hypothetical protein